jgi:site-specific DNA recombinase
LLLEQIEEQELFVFKARKLFLNDKIQFDDFSNIKMEYQDTSNGLKSELEKVVIKLSCLDKQFHKRSFREFFSDFEYLDINDRKYIVNMKPPINFDKDGSFSINLNKALSNILLNQSNNIYQFDSTYVQIQTPILQTRNFKDRRVAVKKAINMLANNGIHVVENDAALILNFLYIVAKSTKSAEATPCINNLKEKSNSVKMTLLNNSSENRPDFKLV